MRKTWTRTARYDSPRSNCNVDALSKRSTRQNRKNDGHLTSLRRRTIHYPSYRRRDRRIEIDRFRPLKAALDHRIASTHGSLHKRRLFRIRSGSVSPAGRVEPDMTMFEEEPSIYLLLFAVRCVSSIMIVIRRSCLEKSAIASALAPTHGDSTSYEASRAFAIRRRLSSVSDALRPFMSLRQNTPTVG